MRVELLTSRATATEYNEIGEIIEVSTREGESLLKAGAAIPVREVRKETTSRTRRSPKAETATK